LRNVYAPARAKAERDPTSTAGTADVLSPVLDKVPFELEDVILLEEELGTAFALHVA
jgi:hypothetical protein